MGVVVREKVEGSGVWWVFIHHDKRRWSQRIGPKRDANAVASEVRRALAEGTFKPAETQKAMPTLAEYAEKWLATYVAGALKPKSQENYRVMLKVHVLPALGHKRLDEISRADVKELVFAKQAAGLAANTIRLVRAPLSRLFTHAIDDGLVSANPCSGIGRYTKGGTPKKEAEPFTAEEAEVLLKAFEKHFPRYHTLALLYLRTGLRPSEGLALKWEDIDFGGRFIEVRRNLSGSEVVSTTKTGKARRVDMSKQLAEGLSAHRLAQKKETLEKGWRQVPEWVFTSETGQVLDLHNFRQRVFSKALEKAKLRKRGPHQCRHAYATLRLAAGHSLQDVQRQLGHSSVKMTLDVYAKWLPGGRKAEVDELDDLGHSDAPPAHPDERSGRSRSAN